MPLRRPPRARFGRLTGLAGAPEADISTDLISDEMGGFAMVRLKDVDGFCFGGVFLLYQKGRDPASFRLKTARSTISKKSMLAKIKARKAVITVQVRRKGFRCRLMNSSVRPGDTEVDVRAST